MSRFLLKRYADMESYTPGEQPRDMEYIKLNTNESPYPPAPDVVECITNTDIELLRLYSDPTGKELKEKLAALYGVKAENVFLSNGSDDILNFAFMAYGGNGAVFPDITYGFYTVFCDLHGVEYTQIPLKDDFSVDYNEYLGLNKLVVIANPNAPTGMSISVGEIEEIVKANPRSVVVIDEAYVDFGGQSCYRLTEKYENLLVVRTFSKSRCMAGGRLGYAIGCVGLIEDLEKIKYSTNPYNINRLTAKLGIATVEAEDYYREKCKEVIETRTFTKLQLEELGCTVTESDANFLFVRHPVLDGNTVYERLKKHGVLVRHFSKERIKDYNRVTIGTRAQMEKFIDIMREITQ